jgi:hypothetical protein
MSDAAIFLGWNRPFQGRESDALVLLERLDSWLGGLKTSAQIGSYTRVMLEPHGGGLAGFVLIEGEVPKLHAIKQTDAWNDGVSRLALVFDGVMVNHALVGAAVERESARTTRLLKR